ncbi:hypothetical protein [Natronospora cellulosivora (SeqCode)]
MLVPVPITIDINQSNYQVNRAEEIAKERYAKGEISKEELDNILINIR